MKTISKMLAVGAAVVGLGLSTVSIDAQAYCGKCVRHVHYYNTCHTGCCYNTCNYCNTCGYHRNFGIWPFFF